MEVKIDNSFKPNYSDLLDGLKPFKDDFTLSNLGPLPNNFPDEGLGEKKVLDYLAPIAIGEATKLDDPLAFAHMDPPTPWITWIMALWNASLNQNLLHPAISPVARDFETKAIDWLCPYFGMNGGHLTPGSTLSNLTALWVARDLKGVKKIVASEEAHISMKKSANILGLEFETVPCNHDSSINVDLLPTDLSKSCLVLSAGTTAAGAIDNLNIANNAAWIHVDAAWAGPLRISQKHGYLLNGVEKADSISISGHKWIFQPKDSSILLFKNTEEANQSISMSAGYLSSSNIGIMGSRGAIGLPLLATLMAWGKEGLAKRLDGCMTLSDELHSHLLETGVHIFAKPTSGVILWRPKEPYSADEIFLRLPAGSASLATISGEKWIRHVAANPNMKIDLLCSEITTALGY